MELIINVDLSTRSRGLGRAQRKFDDCPLAIVDVQHAYRTTYIGLATVTLDQAVLNKYSITPENVGDVDLCAIVRTEFLTSSDFSLYHLEICNFNPE